MRAVERSAYGRVTCSKTKQRIELSALFPEITLHGMVIKSAVPVVGTVFTQICHFSYLELMLSNC